MVAPLPRTLVIDFYDSYTLNLLTLFAPYPDEVVKQQVVVVRFDAYTWDNFLNDVLPHFEAIILSPGPGTPSNSSDFGWASSLVRLCPVPILGVCLGMQGIATSLGGEVKFAGKIEHGQRVEVENCGRGVFEGVDPKQGKWVVYNSLVVEKNTLPEELRIDAWLASDPSQIMGLSHVSKPLWGVQFHPESIHSDLGQLVIQNFLRLADLQPKRTLPTSKIPQHILVASATARHAPEAQPASTKRYKLEVKRLASGRGLSAQRVFEKIVQKQEGGEFWLDSAMKNNHDSSPSYSYLGSRSHTLTYSTTSGLSLHRTGHLPSPMASSASFFDQLDTLQRSLAAQTAFPADGGPDWKAGWVGWMGYGMKSETLAGYTAPLRKGKEREVSEQPPDACLSYVTSVLALDHTTSDWLVIGMVLVEGTAAAAAPALTGSGLERALTSAGVRWALPQAEWEAYIDKIEGALSTLAAQAEDDQPPLPTTLPAFVPDFSGDEYVNRIGRARDLIHSGESYELTLTTQFRTTIPADRTPYDLYRTLRASNPAPYSTFIHLPELGIAVVSSSPERFIKLGKDGSVEMKPIKGTVARVKDDPEEDERVKDNLQNDRKEIAENLMIVDLIRADLLSFCTPSSVKVPKLIQVETFDHVHQLVTTVVGELGDGVGSFEAIGRCFPPGSMTGAPKLRSVQILDSLEDDLERGIYSGAMGYLSLDGAADFNVVIRTIVAQGSELSIGAGGAITWLSNARAEWEEVGVKVGSVVKGF